MRGLPLGAGSLLNAKPHEFGSIERANQHIGKNHLSYPKTQLPEMPAILQVKAVS